MKSADEYRKNAEACRKLAKELSDKNHAALLEKMAKTWDSLANDRDKDRD